jgi:hypothetical protein
VKIYEPYATTGKHTGHVLCVHDAGSSTVRTIHSHVWSYQAQWESRGSPAAANSCHAPVSPTKRALFTRSNTQSYSQSNSLVPNDAANTRWPARPAPSTHRAMGRTNCAHPSCPGLPKTTQPPNRKWIQSTPDSRAQK